MPPFSSCSCHCKDCNQKHDDFVGRVNALTDFIKELTRGVIPSKKIVEPLEVRKLKKAISSSLSNIKKRKISSPPPTISVIPLDLGSTSRGKETTKVTSDMPLKYPFEGYNIFGEGPTQLMSSFSEWIREDLSNRHAHMKDSDEHYTDKCSSLGVKQIDFVVASVTTKNWFYLMSQPNKCWNDEHVDVIFYYLRKKSKQQNNPQYRYTTANCFFKTYIEKASVVDNYEEKIVNIIKGFSIEAGLPWHLTDEVYVPVNCGEIHWILAVVVLKERRISVYDSMSGLTNRKVATEVGKLATMLPKYLQCSGFFEQKDEIDWSAVESYKDKNESHPFIVEYVAGIAQQGSGSLDCGVFIAAYAEFLSDGLQVPSGGIVAESLRTRYASLLWNYGILKARNCYVSDNEDPQRPTRNKLNFFLPPDENDVVTLE